MEWRNLGVAGSPPDLVPKAEKVFGEICAVLARDSSNERSFHVVVLVTFDLRRINRQKLDVRRPIRLFCHRVSEASPLYLLIPSFAADGKPQQREFAHRHRSREVALTIVPGATTHYSRAVQPFTVHQLGAKSSTLEEAKRDASPTRGVARVLVSRRGRHHRKNPALDSGDRELRPGEVFGVWWTFGVVVKFSRLLACFAWRTRER
jgi:hypothetical protein